MVRRQYLTFAILAALSILVALSTGFFTERAARQEKAEAVSQLLTRQASLVAQSVGRAPRGPGAQERLQNLASQAAEAVHARVTLFSSDGKILADSNPAARTPEPDGRLPREVRRALSGRVASELRSDPAGGRALLHTAVPLRGGGAVRLIADPADSAVGIGSLALRALASLGLAILLAFLASLLVSRILSRPLREMSRAAGSIRRGNLKPRLPLQPSDDLEEISQAINIMADQLREQLEETTSDKERLAAVLNAMVEGLLVVDAQGTVLLANDRLRDFWGFRGELVDRTPMEVVRSTVFQDLLEAAARRDDPVQCELEAPNGRLLRARAVRFPPGNVERTGTVAVFYDITELRRLEQVRQDFVANASHELRTPLAAIIGFAETLLHGPELKENEQRAYVEIIERHSKRLEAIVDDLLDLSQAESGLHEPASSLIELRDLMAALVQDARGRAEQRGIAIDLSVEGPARAWAESRGIEQIMSNLLGNAIKYTEPGGRIHVGIASSADSFEVEVSDTGIGIPPADLDRIFERFYRVDKARSRALGGTGLGLSIVRHQIEKFGGRVRVESELGRGSTFYFTLPTVPPTD